MRDVFLDGGFAHAKPRGNLLGRKTLCDERNDLKLARRHSWLGPWFPALSLGCANPPELVDVG